MHAFKKTLIAAAIATTGAAAQAEVSGSVGIASSYLFRGLDLGYGSAVVSGSLDYANEAGIYAGIWGSSGDDTYGSEYDLYAGWGGNITEDFSLDIAYVDYNYPNAQGAFDFEEIVVGLGYGPVSFTWAELVGNVGADADSTYVALGFDVSDFSFVLGNVAGNFVPDYNHFDATYSMGDLAFTISTIDYDLAGQNEDAQFVVSYSIPIE